LGNRLRDIGQSRDPVPPDKITGQIMDMGIFLGIEADIYLAELIGGEELTDSDKLAVKNNCCAAAT